MYRNQPHAGWRLQPSREVVVLVVASGAGREADDRGLPAERDQVLEGPAHLHGTWSRQRRHVPADRQDAAVHAAGTPARKASAARMRSTCACDVWCASASSRAAAPSEARSGTSSMSRRSPAASAAASAGGTIHAVSPWRSTSAI